MAFFVIGPLFSKAGTYVNVDERREDAAGMPGAGRRRLHLRLPRRRHPALLRRASTTTPSATCWCATRKTPAFAAEGYARATGKVGVCCATSGPGATNLVTGLVNALMDSIPVVALTGQVHQQADRQRRLPGSRHLRHHALLHQAQLPGQEPRGPAADHPRGVLHRLQRPSRPGAGGHPQGRLPGPGPLHAGHLHSPARLQGLHRRPHRPDPPRRADDLGSRAAHGLRRRRHHRRGRLGRTARARRNSPTPPPSAP